MKNVVLRKERNGPSRGCGYGKKRSRLNPPLEILEVLFSVMLACLKV